MVNTVIYGMVYLGSAIMIYNIYNYVRYTRQLENTESWGKERRILYLPIALLVLFLIGYLVVGIFGHPDLVISGILFGGSIFVFIIFHVLERITKRIQMDEQKVAELSAAETVSRLKSRFLSSVSHEMRTPMNVIIGLDTIALKNPDLPEETREQLQKIDTNAHHLLCLIDNLLDMSSVESGELQIQEEPFSLKSVLDLTDSITRNQCEGKGLVYESRRENLAWDSYRGDALKLEQLLLILSDNAVKYTPAPGRVVLTVSRTECGVEQDTLRFSVSDTGVGMDPEFVSQIFETFSQEDATSTTYYSGSGLGLSLGRSIAVLMGGDIEVRSEKDRGSTFTVTAKLKRMEEAEAAEEAESDSVSADVLAGIRVLVAEDIDLNAEILEDLLEMEGILSERARDGSEAVRMFCEHESGYYSAILMDLRMPVMDGLSATEAIRSADHPDAVSIPILALTANTSVEDRRNALEAGMNQHLAKPVDIEQLCTVLRKQIRPPKA